MTWTEVVDAFQNVGWVCCEHCQPSESVAELVSEMYHETQHEPFDQIAAAWDIPVEVVAYIAEHYQPEGTWPS